jgi:hypothetical protein
MQPRVLGFRLDEDGNVRVGVFPQREESVMPSRNSMAMNTSPCWSSGKTSRYDYVMMQLTLSPQ